MITARSSRVHSSQAVSDMVYKLSVPQGAGWLAPAPQAGPGPSGEDRGSGEGAVSVNFRQPP